MIEFAKTESLYTTVRAVNALPLGDIAAFQQQATHQIVVGFFVDISDENGGRRRFIVHIIIFSFSKSLTYEDLQVCSFFDSISWTLSDNRSMTSSFRRRHFEAAKRLRARFRSNFSFSYAKRKKKRSIGPTFKGCRNDGVEQGVPDAVVPLALSSK
uniref:Uncharacterized protein n=1 Tax=Romanomermis culicivorax TaxID=13658 RepID=A0A915L0P7_ROMCU